MKGLYVLNTFVGNVNNVYTNKCSSMNIGNVIVNKT